MSLNTEPGINDIARFDVAGFFDIYTVTFPFVPLGADISTDRLIVGNIQVTFEPDRSSTGYIAATSVTTETGRGVIIGEAAGYSSWRTNFRETPGSGTGSAGAAHRNPGEVCPPQPSVRPPDLLLAK